MKKRILSLLLAAATMLAMLPCAVQPASATAVWNGSTKTEPLYTDGVYQIGTGAELAWFAAKVNEEGEKDLGPVTLNAVLTQDINLGGHAWTPIGWISYVTNAYAGTFDGGYYTVSGLKIDAAAANYGLFGTVNGGTVKNLKVSGEVGSTKGVGGIIGKLQTGTVENCSMSGKVTSTGKSTQGYAGGIVGTVTAAGAKINGCCNTAEIAGSYAGGILAYDAQSRNTTHTAYCYNTGKITGTVRCGGIAGQQSKGTICYCYNAGESACGVYGFSNAAITECYYLYDETGTPGGMATGTQKITSKEILLAALCAGESPLCFAADTAMQNNGCPILFWQAAVHAGVPVMRVTISGKAETGCMLTAFATGEGEKTATNVIYRWETSSDGVTFTEIAGSSSAGFSVPDTAEYADKILRVTAVGEGNSTACAVTEKIQKSDTLLHKEDVAKVMAAKDKLEVAAVVKIAQNLLLADTVNGCKVTWKSSDPAIITAAGDVTLPEQNIKTVTLTATLQCGTATAEKTFDVDVWSKYVEPAVYLAQVQKALQWNFRLLQPAFGEDTNILVKFQSILKAKGFDGVSVTVASTDNADRISQNGKITYPVLPAGGSFADGEQVKVYFYLTVGNQTVTYPQGNGNALLVPWDTTAVYTALEQAADDILAEKNLWGENGSLSAVSSDLQLPSHLGEGRYGFAWITWQSSDAAHLFISNEKRENSADALYNPYVGKIYRDETQHEIFLTATVKNPATEVTVKRNFAVTVAPMSDMERNHTLQGMQAILNCYTPEKLTDFSTKLPLNTKAVTGDIQLVIPKNVVSAEELAALSYGKYWDYWNYKFTVTGSDTDVIEINDFRAYVYRPLGETAVANRDVTLTVRMESKQNPNLFVQKQIPVTVKHLTRAEVLAALELMDHAKENYAQGLLGNNTDVYSVIDNLTPFKEMVWNCDKTGVNFIYRHADCTGTGITVDELPEWELQEDWRTFRSSNKDLLANETLTLNRTPAEDTFVKINSVLTNAEFGKYYLKFKDKKNYDAEALQRFKQLYKQPVSAYVMVVGSGGYSTAFTMMSCTAKAVKYSAPLAACKKAVNTPISVQFTLLGLNGEAIVAKTAVDGFTKGATVFDVFKKVLDAHKIPYAARGSYITKINGLKEFDYGGNSGWMYTVGNIFVNSYMNAQELSGGEDIVVMYVTDYRLANMKKPTAPEKEDPAGSTQGSAAGAQSSPAEGTGSTGMAGASGEDTAENGVKRPVTGESSAAGHPDAENKDTGSKPEAVDTAKKELPKSGQKAAYPIILAWAIILLVLSALLITGIAVYRKREKTKQ